MMDGLLITEVKLCDVERVVERAMSAKLGPLAREVQELRDLLRQSRPVITHKIAPLFFDDEVEPETVIDYIKYRGLPAYKNGRKWFIYLADLMDWQIGLIGFSERTDKITILAPRHLNQRHGATQLRQVSLFERECPPVARRPLPSESSLRKLESS